MNPNAAFQMNVKQPVGTGPATTYANGSTITSDMLKPAVNTPFQTPQITPAYPVSTLNSTPAPTDNFQMTQPEIQADSMSTKLQQLNERLVGQSAFKAQQETALGIPELQKTQNDLTSQLNAIKNEALAIPLQLQNDAQGRGITAAGLAPIEAGALRTNAIKALSVNSLLEASRGNLTSALDMVDRAVAQQFDPIKEQIAVTQANLDLILKSPAYSLAEKKRAAAEQKQQDAEKRALDKEEASQKAILTMGAQIAGFGAPKAVLDQVSKATDVNEAFRIAAPYLRDPNEVLQNSLIREQILTQQSNRAINNLDATIKRAQAGDAKAAASLGLDPAPTNKVRLDVKEAAALQKDLAGDDNFKAISKAMDTWRSLAGYEKEVQANGATSALFSPIASGKSASAYQTALLNAKEYFNLGVLNGPDLSILQKVVPSNQTFTPIAPFKATEVQNGINNLKSQLSDKLDTDYLTVSSRFANYDKNQITGLNDLDRKYIQTKMEIDPKIKKFVEENSNLTPEEVIQVINNRI